MKKEYIKQANIRRRTIHPNYVKDHQSEWIKKHPKYMKEWSSRNKEKQRHYREIWNEKHPNYRSEWRKKHPNYMRDYLKEWRSNVKRINAGFTLKIEDVDLAVVSMSDRSIFREIDESMRKEFVSKQDGL